MYVIKTNTGHGIKPKVSIDIETPPKGQEKQPLSGVYNKDHGPNAAVGGGCRCGGTGLVFHGSVADACRACARKAEQNYQIYSIGRDGMIDKHENSDQKRHFLNGVEERKATVGDDPAKVFAAYVRIALNESTLEELSDVVDGIEHFARGFWAAESE